MVYFSKHLRWVIVNTKGHRIVRISKRKSFANLDFGVRRIGSMDGVPLVPISGNSNGLKHMQQKIMNRNNETHIGIMPIRIEVRNYARLQVIIMSSACQLICLVIAPLVTHIG